MRIEELYTLFLDSEGVITDSRKMVKNKLFFALSGPNFNGNSFAKNALEKGAKYAIIDDKKFAYSDYCILVDNSLATLQKLASYHRAKLGLKIFALTGSNGKTTNKELLTAILKKNFNLYSTKGNLNNHIGVPLSILEISSNHDLALIEMGANKIGDIKELCEIADPDYGFITNIGLAHLEGFGSRKNIQLGKGELFEHVRAKGGILFANEQELKVLELIKESDHAVIIGDSENSQYVFRSIQNHPDIRLEFLGKKQKFKFRSHLYGAHNYENVKMACGIGFYFGLKSEIIQEGLGTYIPSNNRSERMKKGNYFIYMDAYNANPSSVKASLSAFSLVENQYKVVILGDMLELGDEASLLHAEIINKTGSYNFDQCIFIGPEYFELRMVKKNMFFYSSLKQAEKSHHWNFPNGTHILVKGSRGLTLEKLNLLDYN